MDQSPMKRQLDHKEEIARKRAKAMAEGQIQRKPGSTYVRICPACEKPNSLVSSFCTGCTFELTQWDEKESPNVFWNLVQGQDIGCVVRIKGKDFIVFDDKYPVSDFHLDCIPTRSILDILALTRADIPLLKELYKAGVEEFKKSNISIFSGKNIEDHVVCGFNYPVSIPHLHLHIVLPPFKHEKVFQYPRWHSYQKVLSDLEKHGKVLTYDKVENKAEWEPCYAAAMKDHQQFSIQKPAKSKSSKLSPIHTEFNAWKKKSKNKTVEWVASNRKENQFTFQVGKSQYHMKYPDPKDPDSSYFLEGVGDDLETDVNEFIFTEAPESLASLLDKIAQCSQRSTKFAQSGDMFLADSDEEGETADQANAREFGVGADWFKNTGKISWFCDLVVKEIKAARALLGEDAIRTSGLGLCSLVIDISEAMDDTLQGALELFKEPCTVEFDFDTFWGLSKQDRVPLPVFRVRQLTNNEGNHFGCSFHLKEVIHRYLEDNFKWSEKPLISLGTFDNNKGINTAQEPKKQQTKGRGLFGGSSASPPPQQPGAQQQVGVDPIMVEKLRGMGFNKESVEAALRHSKNHYERAVERLLTMGEAAIEKAPSPKSAGPQVNLQLENEILEMGFSRDQARKALQRTKNNLEDAIAILLTEGELTGEQELRQSFEREKENLSKSSGKDSKDIDLTPQLSRSETNLFVGMASYLKMRLQHYMRFCMICHKRHACHNDKPVVCCSPLCIFRYSEVLPQNKKEKIRQVDRITICPFTACDNIARSDTMAELTAAFGDHVHLDDGNNQQQMLALLSHRYLPNEDVMKFINVGVKQSGQVIAKIENVLKPELVALYEARWATMKKTLGTDLSKPNIAYHGTAEANINSILERGLLVPGKGSGADVKHATDNGWWGGGIYLAPDPQLSIGYCRGGKKLLICSVLMGRRYIVNQRMDGAGLQAGHDSHVACGGTEWVIFEPSQVLPCYLVSFKQ